MLCHGNSMGGGDRARARAPAVVSSASALDYAWAAPALACALAAFDRYDFTAGRQRPRLEAAGRHG